MESDRWHRLSALFHEALEREPALRTAFLDEACGQDTSLRSEIASLLAYHDQVGATVDTPTHLVGAGAVDNDFRELLAGETLGQYEVVKQLGRGGMGVVYLANDIRLGRQVAVKALSSEFTNNAERRERLRREARAVAGLSHPGIAMVYALEEFSDSLYIVSEYVQGQTLREELATGPLSLKALLTTGIEIARALAAAHRHGVIHRDLKPDNVIRTTDGQVKILDFGLARVREPEGERGPGGARLTARGAILGTPGYMPPEQLRGAEVDARADIFSFGVLLYELASGTHPFVGETAASTIARVLESEPPDVAQLRRACPAALDQIIRTCLEKEPEHRYASTDELLDALQQLHRDTIETTEPRSSGSRASTDISQGTGTAPASPLWWWQCHQAIIGVGYYLMLLPLWSVRPWIPEAWGSRIFFGGVAVIGVAATLRFHLWFTSHFYQPELTAQRKQAALWIRRADWAFVGLLLVVGGLLAAEHVGYAALFVAVAVGSFVGFMVIEPATTRAAFKRRPSRTSR